MAWPSERSRDGGMDEIPLPAPLSGRLFLCGKHAIGPDHVALMDRVDATTVVCLTEIYELEDRYPDYTEWLRANLGTHALHHPYPTCMRQPSTRCAGWSATSTRGSMPVR